MAKSGLGPFRPGPGRLPPYLAGREEEQDFFRALLADLRHGLAPPGEVVLFGPRGNGKTALLLWLRNEAAAEPGLDLLRLDPSDFRSEQILVEQVLSDSFWRRLRPKEISLSGISWRPGQEGPPTLKRALTARVRKKPLVLLLDEAHTLDRGVGRALLNASQTVGGELPFLLVLAGTPDLRARLSGMSASFWNRAEKRPLGRLDGPAAAEAIARPLAADGIGITRDALDRIVRESHGYPYFVQLLGRAVWRAVAGAPTEGRCVTAPTVEAANPEFERHKKDYYLDRYDELDALHLLPVARSVADAFAREPLLTGDGLKRAIGRGLDEGADRNAVAAAAETLRHLGFVWRPGSGDPVWEAGIPSLMDYLREHVPPGPR